MNGEQLHYLKGVKMFVGELLIRKRYVKMQIEEFKKYLESEDLISDINETLNKLFGLEDKYQQYSAALDEINRATEIEFGNNKVIMTNILKLRDTTSNKINVFTDLIENNKASLDIVNLMEQRTKFIEEYVLLSRAVNISDWQVEID